VHRKRSVVAIWLDSADRATVEEMIASGKLPNLKQLRSSGAYARLQNVEPMLSETAYSTLMTGCSSATINYWSWLHYDAESCSMRSIGGYDFREFAPFYALSNDVNVCVFDVPKAVLRDDLRGIQVLGWGAHSDSAGGRSMPGELLCELEDLYGKSPAHRRDHADLGDARSILALWENLQTSLERRLTINRDLLRRDKWDLFFTAFSELHAGTHFIWPHPDLDRRDGFPINSELQIKLYQTVDAQLGELLKELDEATTVIVFSVEGMTSNRRDLPAMVFLPELMFRYSFPGKIALESDPARLTPSPESQAGISNWVMEIWNHRVRTGKFSSFLREKLGTINSVLIERMLGVGPTLFQPELFTVANFQPAVWYSPYWPYMKAFALPTFSDGYIRVNVRGRDKGGVVAPGEYYQVCSEIEELLHDLKDPATGAPIVSRVMRTRRSVEPFEQNCPCADLIVFFSESVRNSTFSSRLGKLGPMPYLMAGSHNTDGFMIVAGPGVAQGSTLNDGCALDVAPTILDALKLPIPEHMEGKSLIDFQDRSVRVQATSSAPVTNQSR